jgi:hypothetical protein
MVEPRTAFGGSEQAETGHAKDRTRRLTAAFAAPSSVSEAVFKAPQ